jgi:hypothetical protein
VVPDIGVSKLGKVLLAGALAISLSSVESKGQSAAATGEIDEAFRLAGVREALDQLPDLIKETSILNPASFTGVQQRQVVALVRQESVRTARPAAMYSQLRTWYVRHYDADRISTFSALEKSPRYRTMRRMEEMAASAANLPMRRRFEANLQNDPPSAARLELLKRLDSAGTMTGLQVRLASQIPNTIMINVDPASAASNPASAGPGNDAAAKAQSMLSRQVLVAHLFAFRNVDDETLANYVQAAEQKDVTWFYRNLESAALAVVALRSQDASESLKTQMEKIVSESNSPDSSKVAGNTANDRDAKPAPKPTTWGARNPGPIR